VAHFGVVRHFSGALEEGLTDGLLERIFAARKEAAALRRRLGPLREGPSNLVSGVPYVDEDLRPFFRDVHDKVLRLLDELETNRDGRGGLLESYLSRVSNGTNAVMKRLTRWR
jgi:magnesium transporter